MNEEREEVKLETPAPTPVKQIMYFESAYNAIQCLFEAEFEKIPNEDLQRFLSLFYIFSNYKEEVNSIKPTLYITNGINSIIKNVPSASKIILFTDSDGTLVRARMKAMACFCLNNWDLYINFGSGKVEYGIIKAMNSVKDKSLADSIFSSNELKEKIELIRLNVIGGGRLEIRGIQGNELNISFNFLPMDREGNWREGVEHFVDAITEKLKTKSKKKAEEVKNVYKNMFSRLLKNSHGTICLVVDKDFKDIRKFLRDGVWLQQPINFSNVLLKNFSEYKFQSYSDVLASMLDFDGITVIDNSGQILAYNVFIESKTENDDRVIGGARLRAANTLLSHPNKKIVGVYFQSTNGYNFFKDAKFYQHKKKRNKPDSIVDTTKI